MIARTWRGSATIANADAYEHHFTTNVVPHLQVLEGHKGAFLLRRERDGQIDFVAVTLWDSIETIRRFAGPDAEKANVEPRARAILSGFDEIASNYQVVHDSGFGLLGAAPVIIA